MGYACASLIPAAILLDNPGITREEYAELVNQTNCSTVIEFSRESPWDFTQTENARDNSKSINHEGLHGIADILSLNETSKYQKTEQIIFDQNGLRIPNPSL